MKRIVVFVFFALILLPTPGLSQGTPTTTGPVEKSSATALELTWPTDSVAPLGEGEGQPVWSPISARFIAADADFYFFSEFRNTSPNPLIAPILSVELLTEGQSFGSERLSPTNEWVPAGGSVFYQSLSFFGNSLLIGDWDDQVFSLEPNTYADVDMSEYESLRIDGDRIFNDGGSPIGEIYFAEIIRDSAGIFTASCGGPATGALIPPGKSVRAPGLTDGNEPGRCGFSQAGMDGSASLGYEDDFVNAFVIGQIT